MDANIDWTKVSYVEFKIDPNTGDLTSEGKNISGPHCTEITDQLQALLGNADINRKMKPEGLPKAKIARHNRVSG